MTDPPMIPGQLKTRPEDVEQMVAFAGVSNVTAYVQVIPAEQNNSSLSFSHDITVTDSLLG